MKISELILKLEEKKLECGDVNVAVYGDVSQGEDEWVEVNFVYPSKINGVPFVKIG